MMSKESFLSGITAISAVLAGAIIISQMGTSNSPNPPLFELTPAEPSATNASQWSETEISQADLVRLILSRANNFEEIRQQAAAGQGDPVLQQLPAVCFSDLPGLTQTEQPTAQTDPPGSDTVPGDLIHDSQVAPVGWQDPSFFNPANNESYRPYQTGHTPSQNISASNPHNQGVTPSQDLPTAGGTTGINEQGYGNAVASESRARNVSFGYPSPNPNPNTSSIPVPGVANDGAAWNPHAKATDNAPLRNDSAVSNPLDHDPHANVFANTPFPSAQECASCHQQIYDEWAVSSHAYAAISPMFHVFEQKINDLSQGTVGYFCLRCHAPVATTMGLRRDQPIWDGPKVFREGVTCVTCHRVKTPYTKANGERRIEPGDINAPVYGACDGVGVDIAIKYKDFYKVMPDEPKGLGLPIHRRAIQFEELSESTFCASCHQVAVQPGIKLEVVWDQYRASPAYREGTSCQDCHMGAVPGVAEGYSVGPGAVVNDKVVNPERKHSNHMFYGPGYPITHPGIFPFSPEADRWSFNEWLLFDWQAGWGTEAFEQSIVAQGAQPYFPSIWQSADDRMDAREIIDKNIQKIAYKKDIRRQVLENGSQLDGPFFTSEPSAGSSLKFYYCLTNLNRGHNMPSGSLGAQPQIWMNVVLVGPDGGRLWETGYLDADGDLADNHSREVLNYRIPLDEQLFNLQTKFLTTNVKGTDREMYLPVNVDIDQLPFLRPAPQPVTVINHPPFIRMEGHSLPPTATRKAKFSIPKNLIQVPGTYRLSVRMRSRSHPVYFMRFCEATPEMMKAMNLETVDFHVQSSVFEVR